MWLLCEWDKYISNALGAIVADGHQARERQRECIYNKGGDVKLHRTLAHEQNWRERSEQISKWSKINDIGRAPGPVRTRSLSMIFISEPQNNHNVPWTVRYAFSVFVLCKMELLFENWMHGAKTMQACNNNNVDDDERKKVVRIVNHILNKHTISKWKQYARGRNKNCVCIYNSHFSRDNGEMRFIFTSHYFSFGRKQAIDAAITFCF